MHPEAHDEHPVVQAGGRAQEGVGVAHPAHVELHGEGVEGDADGPVLEEPLGHLVLVLGDLHPARHPHRHLGAVELAGLVLPVIPVCRLRLKAAEVYQGLVGIRSEERRVRERV